jgi:hypothetical protein
MAEVTTDDLRGMQQQISDVLRDYASRIRNGGDLATVQKVLGEIRDSAAEFLRQTGGSQETVHLDAPGGAACADPSARPTSRSHRGRPRPRGSRC